MDDPFVSSGRYGFRERRIVPDHRRACLRRDGHQEREGEAGSDEEPPQVRVHVHLQRQQITEPFSAAWMPESLRQYDRVTRDEYLRVQGVYEAVLHMMNLGYTPVARFRSFLDVLHENAVYRELSRQAGTENEQIIKIDGGNDRLPRAFADRLVDRLKYGCAVHKIEHDAQGVRVFFRTGQSVESAEAGYVVCAVPFSTLRSVAFLPLSRPRSGR